MGYQKKNTAYFKKRAFVVTVSFIVSQNDCKDLKKRYQQRRIQFMKHLDAPAIIIGLKRFPEENLTPWDLLPRSLKQIPLLLHLTGINEKNIALFMDPNTQKSILFVAKFNANTTLWDGQNLCYKNLKQANIIAKNYGFDEIKSIEGLSDFLLHKIKEQKFLKLNTLWYCKKNKRPNKDACYNEKQILLRLFKRHHLNIKLQSLECIEWQERLPFDHIDIQVAKKIQALTKICFINTIKHIKHCNNEMQIAGYLNGQLQQVSSLGCSFPSIVASGKNACVLHYHENSAPLNKKELLLLDFGLRYADLVSDISRTIPLSGKFNPLQKLVYQQVLKAQNFVQENIKPGAILQEINTKCWQYLHENLKKSLASYNGDFQTAYLKAPHFVSHFIKTAVHDGDYQRQYQQRGLRVGECISNEPGFYGMVHATINGIKYQENIGIRIEDNLLVTKSGCENLSKDIPKTCEELEQLMNV